MTTITCTDARRLLQAFYDEELSVGDQIAVGAHVARCDDCAGALEDLQDLGSALRTLASEARTRESVEDERAFHRGVVARLTAEDSVSLASRVRDVFEDMRLVYAGLGATAAAVACFLMMLNMMRFVTDDRRPDSLAAKVSTLALLETNQGIERSVRVVPVVSDARLLSSSGSGAPFAADAEDDLVFDNVDAEFVISYIVTREGRVANLEVVHADSGQPLERGTREAVEIRNAFQKMMGAVAQARYEPATVAGLPVAVNKVVLIAHTTVHGNKEARALADKSSPLSMPGAGRGKKRLTSAPVPQSRSSAA